MASQLGNVVQSSVDASGRGEAGGLQYTGQQLGSSLGVALIGAIVLTGLTGAFISNIQADAAHQRQRRHTGEHRGRDRHRLRRLHRDREGRQRRRTEQVGNERDRRRLREGTTRRAQGRPARRRVARARLTRVHRRPAPRRPPDAPTTASPSPPPRDRAPRCTEQLSTPTVGMEQACGNASEQDVNAIVRSVDDARSSARGNALAEYDGMLEALANCE